MGSRSYPPVEGFLLAASGHTQEVGRAKETGSAADFLPKERSLSALKGAAAGCRGATCGSSGRRPCSATRLTQNRRQLVESDLAPAVTATIYPSAILRGDPERRKEELAALVGDLRFAAALL